MSIPDFHAQPFAPKSAAAPREEVSLPDLSADDSYGSGLFSIDNVLRTAVKAGASDIHFSSGTPVRARIDGDLQALNAYPHAIEPDWLRAEIYRIFTKMQQERFEEANEADLSYALEGYGRFRVNVFIQKSNPAAVFRIIPTEIKTLEELKVPESLKEIAKLSKGLVLVTGPTGSGKSTTLTGIIDYINSTRPDHIMTIEDPIEFVHTSKRSLVNQREVFSDTHSFAEALKRVLRQDPDVILVGELRDPETIATALTAAETGHLVFGTLHTQSAAKSIDRLVDSFPATQQSQVRSQLAGTLQAIVSQLLLKKIGGGRVAATEILRTTTGIAANIREGHVSQIYSEISTGSSKGMHTLDQDLARLVGAGLIEREEAARYAVDPSSLEGLTPRYDTAWRMGD